MVYYRDQQIDDAFFALSHPVRRKMLDRLTRGCSSVAEVSEPFDLSPAQATKHIAILERGGLISRNRQGRSHQLSLKPDMLEEIGRWLERYQKFWDDRLNALDTFLAQQEQSGEEK